ncbi:glycosyltransferase family 4 protein [Crystallibacter degradans]|uniref:glycosyltransferase family 4 protein n=1 Tax=Crystallibacter degradans TaxID=2726743 RepID=UPI001475BC28|nr:glycosyltransferase family 4 protein [Arthrobacter sp. SF27]NMR28215.1 glycosyltransferase family 4 protein [Arthrobacter sp. SF27]
MKILVYPHDLAIGGSQLNAIEITAAIKDLGHEVVVFGQPGPLVSRISELGLEFVEAPSPRLRPTPAIVRALLDVVDSRGIDIVHGYEWPPTLECLLAAKRRRGLVAVSTIMSMAVAPFIPTYVPLCVGTEEIAAAERQFGRSVVALLEPPVDTALNGPNVEVGLEAFRREWGLDTDAYTVVSVSRLAHQLKLEGLLGAIAAVEALSAEIPTRLVIVGDGPARTEVMDAAAAVNNRTGQRTVVLTGELTDPRPAYAAADVALGMGGSALRAMAFAKPLVVQGENGFWVLLDPTTLPEFLWHGWYGAGQGAERGAPELVRILKSILPEERLRSELGNFGANTVRNRFSLQLAAQRQLQIYRDALSHGTNGPNIRDDISAARRYLGYSVGRLLGRFFDRAPADDFNSRPLAAGRQPATEARSLGS